jgi:hypothetical protein
VQASEEESCEDKCPEGVVVDSCNPLFQADIIQQRCGTIEALDPDNPNQILVVEEGRTGRTLDDLTNQAIDDVMQMHGLPDSERSNVRIWARDRVRAQIFTRLVNIVTTAENDRTDDEQTLYDWLTNVVWQKRIDAAQAAWDQYRVWDQARATCTYHEPDATGYLGFNSSGGLENKNACVTNGGTCFVGLNSFEYGYCDLSSCDPATYPPNAACAFELFPAHPSYPDFKAYGAAIGNKVYAEEPSSLSILTGTGKGLAMVGIGVQAAVLIGALFASFAFVPGLAAAVSTAVFPFAGGSAAGAVSVGLGIAGVLGVVLIAVIAAIIIIIGVIQLADFEHIPVCLKEDIKIAAGINVSPRQCDDSSQQGKPNLATLITTKEGKQEIFLAFVAATVPEPANTATAPAPQTTPFWAVRDGSNTPLPDENGPLLDLTSWPDEEDNDTFLQAGLYNGWFVAKFPLAGGGTKNVLTLGIEYVTPTGEKWTAWRSKCEEEATTAPCSPGKEIFILTRNGDEPPTGLSDEDFAEWFAKANTEITYKDANGNTRIASLHTAPTVSGFLSTGDLKEGTELSLSVSSSPSDATLAWDFDDGNTGSGSPVLHTFADNGTFDIEVTATDAFGSSSEAETFPLTIASVAPTATFTFPAEVNEGATTPFNLGLTGPFDPSSADTTAGFQYAFDCTPSGPGQTPTSIPYSSTSSASCPTPTDNGTVAVAGRIKDKDNDKSEYTNTVQVKNVPPTATFAATAQIVRGESSTLAFTNPIDPSSVDTAAGFKHSFDCTNDGTLEVNGSATPSHACRYATAGTFTAKGVIADKDLGSTPYTAQVTVASLQQTAEPLRTQLQAFKTQKVLKKKELDTLLNDRLTYTIERLDTLVNTAKGREAATTALNEFLANVNTFVSQGILTAAQGQTLRETATRLLAVVASFAV